MKIILGVGLVAALAVFFAQRSSAERQRVETVSANLSGAKEGLGQLESLPRLGLPDDAYADQRDQLASTIRQALDAVIAEADAPARKADALAARADLAWTLASLPTPAGATTRPALAPQQSRDESLDRAAADWDLVLTRVPRPDPRRRRRPVRPGGGFGGAGRVRPGGRAVRGGAVGRAGRAAPARPRRRPPRRPAGAADAAAPGPRRGRAVRARSPRTCSTPRRRNRRREAATIGRGRRRPPDLSKRRTSQTTPATPTTPDSSRSPGGSWKNLTRRLDQYLTDRVGYLSRSAVQRLIADEAVHVNGRKTKSSYHPPRGRGRDHDRPAAAGGDDRAGADPARRRLRGRPLSGDQQAGEPDRPPPPAACGTARSSTH